MRRRLLIARYLLFDPQKFICYYKEQPDKQRKAQRGEHIVVAIYDTQCQFSLQDIILIRDTVEKQMVAHRSRQPSSRILCQITKTSQNMDDLPAQLSQRSQKAENHFPEIANLQVGNERWIGGGKVNWRQGRNQELE